jgi:hypothetical protein
MSSDDSSDLRLRAGKIRDRGSGAARRPRSFVAQVMKAVTKAKGGGSGRRRRAAGVPIVGEMARRVGPGKGGVAASVGGKRRRID